MGMDNVTILGPDSPLIAEMDEWTIGEVRDLGHEIALGVGADLDDINLKARDLCIRLFEDAEAHAGGDSGAEGLRATALVIHSACNLMYSALGSLRMAMDMMRMHEELDG